MHRPGHIGNAANLPFSPEQLIVVEGRHLIEINSVDGHDPAFAKRTQGTQDDLAAGNEGDRPIKNGPATMSAEAQLEMFEALLQELGDPADMVNEVIKLPLTKREKSLRSSTLFLLSRCWKDVDQQLLATKSVSLTQCRPQS